jgi:hypothetical protein
MGLDLRSERVLRKPDSFDSQKPQLNPRESIAEKP